MQNTESKLCILSYNIHKGFKALSGSYVLEQLREAIRSSGADIVFLQEVLGQHIKIKETNQYEYLADTIWSHYSYGKNAIYDDGHHGNAILSKFPFVVEDNLDISTNPLEQRGVLYGKIELPNFDKPIQLFCTHLNLFESSRKFQLKKLVEFVQSRTHPDDPLIIAGDFNDWSERASLELMSSLGVSETSLALTGRHAKTFPSILPVLPLDRIYVKNLEIISTHVLFKEHGQSLSDHLPIRAEIGLVRTQK
jgi:endonuclease/exonuclease/phosphatase family metal-dependent hydrolase